MTGQWVEEFYLNQHEFGKSLFSKIPNSLFENLADEIQEQVGVPFQSVLELGGGHGNLSMELAKRDKNVTMIELVPEISEEVKNQNKFNLEVINEDFYDVQLDKTFDLLLYIDGFGIGDTSDQITLLQRIYNWMNDDGTALIDIYQPQYWRTISGIEMQIHPNLNVMRRYGYDFENDRMLDTWWRKDNPEETYTQSLACYSHEEINALVEAAGLTVVGYFPGGMMDYENKTWYNHASLNDCLAYRVKLKKNIDK